MQIPNQTCLERQRVCPAPDVPVEPVFDHRVIDGAVGMRFTVFLAKLLKDFAALPCNPIGFQTA